MDSKDVKQMIINETNIAYLIMRSIPTEYSSGKSKS